MHLRSVDFCNEDYCYYVVVTLLLRCHYVVVIMMNLRFVEFAMSITVITLQLVFHKASLTVPECMIR